MLPVFYTSKLVFFRSIHLSIVILSFPIALFVDFGVPVDSQSDDNRVVPLWPQTGIVDRTIDLFMGSGGEMVTIPIVITGDY